MNAFFFHSGPVVFHHLIHFQTWVIPTDFLQMCSFLRFLTTKGLRHFCPLNCSDSADAYEFPLLLFDCVCDTAGRNPLTRICNKHVASQPPLPPFVVFLFFKLAFSSRVLESGHHWELLDKCSHMSPSCQWKHQQAFNPVSCFLRFLARKQKQCVCVCLCFAGVLTSLWRTKT